jgi:hypothetical protein
MTVHAAKGLSSAVFIVGLKKTPSLPQPGPEP